jgi:hypothetical protein
LWFGKQSCRV